MKRRIQHAFYEARKRVLLPVLKFVNWLISKLRLWRNDVSKSMAENQVVRDVVQPITEVLKKYDHKKGRVVWKSRVWGTYVRAIHGELK